jgi:hypothetical protein
MQEILDQLSNYQRLFKKDPLTRRLKRLNIDGNTCSVMRRTETGQVKEQGVVCSVNVG